MYWFWLIWIIIWEFRLTWCRSPMEKTKTKNQKWQNGGSRPTNYIETNKPTCESEPNCVVSCVKSWIYTVAQPSVSVVGWQNGQLIHFCRPLKKCRGKNTYIDKVQYHLEIIFYYMWFCLGQKKMFFFLEIVIESWLNPKSEHRTVTNPSKPC